MATAKSTKDTTQKVVKTVKPVAVEIEEGLVVDAVFNPNDFRLPLALEEFERLSKFKNPTDKQALMMVKNTRTLIEVLIGREQFDQVINFYVEKNDEFTVEDMGLVLSKIYEANPKD